MHQLNAALLGQFALFLATDCTEQVVQSHISTMAHKNRKKILNGSCQIKRKNSYIQTGSTVHRCLILLKSQKVMRDMCLSAITLEYMGLCNLCCLKAIFKTTG